MGTCQGDVLFVAEGLLVVCYGLVPVVSAGFSFALFVAYFLDFFCGVYQFDHLRMTYSFSWLKLNQRKCFKTHIGYHKGMLTVETSIFIWNYRICHWAPGTRWQNGVFITKRLWSNRQASKFHFFSPTTINNQMR